MLPIIKFLYDTHALCSIIIILLTFNLLIRIFFRFLNFFFNRWKLILIDSYRTVFFLRFLLKSWSILELKKMMPQTLRWYAVLCLQFNLGKFSSISSEKTTKKLLISTFSSDIKWFYNVAVKIYSILAQFIHVTERGNFEAISWNDIGTIVEQSWYNPGVKLEWSCSDPEVWLISVKYHGSVVNVSTEISQISAFVP